MCALVSCNWPDQDTSVCQSAASNLLPAAVCVLKVGSVLLPWDIQLGCFVLCKQVGQGNELEEMSNVQPFREVTDSVMVWYFLSSSSQGFCPTAGGSITVALAWHLFGASWGQCGSGKIAEFQNCTSGFLECAAALAHWRMISCVRIPHGKRWRWNTEMRK